jgi:hypothetical protein
MLRLGSPATGFALSRILNELVYIFLAEFSFFVPGAGL